MSLDRAMQLATMDLDAIKPAPEVKQPLVLVKAYSPNIGDVFGSWTVASKAYNKTVTRSTDGKNNSRRYCNCDCSCGRTLNYAVEVYRLRYGEALRCMDCSFDRRRKKAS